MDIPLLPCSCPYKLAAISHHPPTLLTAVPRLSHKSKSKLCYDRQSVGQSVLVSSTHLELKTRFLFVRELRVCWCGAASLTRGRVCLLQCTMYLHFTCYYMNIYTIYTRLLSVQAQYNRSCPIFSSFRQ
jgi:hypothetical protein